MRLLQDKKERKQVSKMILRALRLSEEDVVKPTILPLNRFNVFGCELSTDIDVLCAVDSAQEVNYEINMDELRHELSQLGYDVSRDIDVNLAFIENGSIQITSRGSKET